VSPSQLQNPGEELVSTPDFSSPGPNDLMKARKATLSPPSQLLKKQKINAKRKKDESPSSGPFPQDIRPESQTPSLSVVGGFLQIFDAPQPKAYVSGKTPQQIHEDIIQGKRF
jgi:hypothetical protein